MTFPLCLAGTPKEDFYFLFVRICLQIPSTKIWRVIRQKTESQNGCFKKTKHAKFSERRRFLPPDKHTYLCVSGSKNRSFFGKFGMFCFLEKPVLRFALLPYYRHFAVVNWRKRKWLINVSYNLNESFI